MSSIIEFPLSSTHEYSSRLLVRVSVRLFLARTRLLTVVLLQYRGVKGTWLEGGVVQTSLLPAFFDGPFTFPAQSTALSAVFTLSSLAMLSHTDCNLSTDNRKLHQS